jgi:hypothetical protein
VGRALELGEVGRRGLEILQQAAQLVVAQQLVGLRQPRLGRGDRGGQLAQRRGEVAREPARARQRGVELREGLRGVPRGRAQLLHGGAQVGGVRGGRADRPVEVDDEVGEVVLLVGERREGLRQPAHRPRQVVRPGAEERAEDLGVLLQGPRAGLERLVERLAAAHAAHRRVLDGVLRRRRLGVERLAEALQRLLERRARVGLQRGQHLVELDRRRGLRHRDQPAVVELAGAGRARLEVDVEVALEEQPRPDLHRRVAVDRLAVVVDAQRDDREVGLLVAPDLDDLADVDARDAHRRLRAQQVGVLDDGLDLEVVAERDRLGEAEVDDDRGQDQRQQAGADGRHPEVVVAPHLTTSGRVVLSTNMPWSPGSLPISWRSLVLP